MGGYPVCGTFFASFRRDNYNADKKERGIWPMKWHFAGIWETVADAVPHAPALSFEGRTTSWAAYEDRAARLASALKAAGIGHDCKAAIYAFNSPAWLEAQFAIFKARAWPINVNYRYVESRALKPG